MQYDPAFTERRPILSDDEKRRLHDFSGRLPLARLKIDEPNYAESVINFVHTSAKLEGNAYERSETDTLLRHGLTAGGRPFSDAVMLLNLFEAFKKAASASAETPLGAQWVCALHAVAMRGLLPDTELGAARTRAVAISASSYQPLTGAKRLRDELTRILPLAGSYTDPFERAIYLHCNLAYLQHFSDGNKRCARLAQATALMQCGIVPLLFDMNQAARYLRATISYYETGDYAPYIAFFIENYGRSIRRLTGEYLESGTVDSHDEFRQRLAHLPLLEHATGAAYTFWRLFQESLTTGPQDRDINWPAIERQTIIDSIANYGLSPESVANALCTYSPGACTPEAQAALREEIHRIAPILHQQAAAQR